MVELIAVLIAILAGLYIRSRVQLDEAATKTQAISDYAVSLHRNLTDQQLADAIAAEAHDTLAHSLSLIALNASALQGEARAFIQLADATNPHETGQMLTPNCGIRLRLSKRNPRRFDGNPQEPWMRRIPSSACSVTPNRHVSSSLPPRKRQ